MPHYRSEPVGTASCVTSTDEAASSKSDFELYPNPTDGFVTISTPQEGTLRLFDATGRLVQTQEIRESATLDVSALPRGLYICTFQDAGGNIASKKLVKH